MLKDFWLWQWLQHAQHYEIVIAQMFCTDFDAADYHMMSITGMEKDTEGLRRQNKNMFFTKGTQRWVEQQK